MKRKAIMLIIDGLGDNKKPKTPLELAKKPNLNRITAKGITGMLSPLGTGIKPPSDKSHLVLLGYDLEKDYCGRGPMEALGAGIELKKGDIAFRGNFATIKDNEIINRRAGRIDTKSAKELAKELSMTIEDVEIIVTSTVEHRAAIVFKGIDLGEEVSDTDPRAPQAFIECTPKNTFKENEKTARIVNEFNKIARERLEKHKLNLEREKEGKLPANILLLRGSGKFRKVFPMKEKFKINGACIAGGALYKGVAKYVGMDIIEVKGATGDKNTNLKAKGEAALKALKKYDFVFLHVKAVDSYSHDKDCEGKRKMIEKIDKELIPYLIKSKAILVVTGDHSTSCTKGEHTSDFVPIVISGREKDPVNIFDEKNCKNGELKVIQGREVFSKLRRMMKKTH